MTRIEELRQLITNARRHYYNTGQTMMPDETYDALVAEYEKLAPNDPFISQVGASIMAEAFRKKVKHDRPMGSLNKEIDQSGISKWHAASGGGRIVAEIKLDGSSIACYYSGGKLQRVITRGSGDEGLDITASAIKFHDIPHVVQDNRQFSVRGEAIMSVEDWRKLDPEIVANPGTTNPRNFGNGIIVRSDGTQSEYIRFRAFDIDCPECYTEQCKLTKLAELGFQTPEYGVFDTISNALAYYDILLKDRNSMDFWSDGVVFKLNDILQQSKLGANSQGTPKGMRVLKWPVQGAETTLTGVVITMGTTGTIVPNGRIEPVQIGGTTVKGVLLNNYQFIKDMDLAIGDKILMVKAGDIIPYVAEIIERPANRKPIVEPKNCPICNSLAIRQPNSDGSDGVITVCSNPSCQSKVSGKIMRWINSLNILGIGQAVLDAMVEQLNLKSPVDLYTIDREKLATMKVSGVLFGDARADTIINEINAKRELSVDQFIGSLGVRYLGKRKVEIIRESWDKAHPDEVGYMDCIEHWLTDPVTGSSTLIDHADDLGIPGIAEDVQGGLDAIADMISKFLKHITVVSVVSHKPSGKYNICLTGAMSLPRKEIEAKIISAGHSACDDVGSSTTHLCQADQNSQSNKSKKAAKKGIPTISEDELKELIGVKW